jgi:hypothetical protein
MTTTETAPALPNGVNVEALLGAREAFKGDTSLTKFQWRAGRGPRQYRRQ